MWTENEDEIYSCELGLFGRGRTMMMMMMMTTMINNLLLLLK